MANPFKYVRGFSFSGWQATRPTKPLPGPNMDDELSKVSQSVEEIIDAIADVRRADGKLQNQIVTVDSLAPDLLFGLQTPVAWTPLTAYTKLNAVYVNETGYFGIYRCKTTHTSAALFATDFAAGRWELVFSLQAVANALTPSQAVPYLFDLANGVQDINISTLPGSPGNTVNRLVLNGVELVRGSDRDWYMLNATTVRLVSPIATDDAPAIAVIYITADGPLLDRFDERFDLRYGYLRYYANRDTIAARPAYGGVFPGGTKQTIMLAPGAADLLSSNFNRSIIIGAQAGSRVIDVDRIEAVGDNAMMYTRYGTRNTAFGSIAMQWLGTNDPVGTGHNYWAYNDGSGTPKNPGDAGWNYDDLEISNPGIGLKIKNWVATNPWATQSSDIGYNVGVGRNAFNGTLVGSQNTAIGYRASAGALFTNQMVTIGCDAGRKGVFLKDSVAIGYAAATLWQEGERNFVGGFLAGSNGVRGSRNTLLGAYAGSNYADINDSVMIGHGAGNGLGGTAKNGILAINVTNGAPLISGNFLATGGDTIGPNAGVNIIPGDILGTLHVRSAKRGAGVLALDSSADNFLVEDSGSVGMTLIAGNLASRAQLYFTAPDRPGNYAGIGFSFALDRLTLRSAGVDQMYITSSGIGFFGAPAANKPTSVPVTAAGVHAALVTLGLISA